MSDQSTMSNDVQDKPIVLVIDDSESIRQLLGISLKRAGYRPLLAANGHVGLVALKKFPAVKAIILDMMMPIMNGTDFIHHLKQLDRTDIPIIVLTGMNDFVASERLKLPEIKAVLTKPVDLALLLKLLKDSIVSV